MILFAIASIERVCMAATAFPAALAYHFFSHTPFDFIIRHIMASLFPGVADACIAARLGQLAHVQKYAVSFCLERTRFDRGHLPVGHIASVHLQIVRLLLARNVDPAISELFHRRLCRSSRHVQWLPGHGGGGARFAGSASF
jgi:hypothetical protein